MIVEGLNGQIELTGSKVIITRKGILSVLSKGFAGEKVIPINSITTIQFKKGSLISGNGFIKFCYAGSIENRGNLSQAVKDDNAVIFRKKHNKDFENLKNKIEELKNQ
ncbi:DUF4429 domain-containing protein [Anaerophilus nitritogenes]|uniref:DUF4429 domain-containing protein n=1 Tax=Anaerophilus nitritogenes TaxID=2498136 RepID=UPI00101D71A9|nr:DUF4429 domain-containing protein [Anaerophilus nitritogenes]